MTTKLGPCPLCGGEAEWAYKEDAIVCCGKCGKVMAEFEDWNRLSALAASERRMREALERCRAVFAGSAAICWKYNRGPRAMAMDELAKVCEEALKGGEG